MVPTIKVKFLAGFFIIFSVSLLLLNHFVVQIIETSNEKIITQDLIELKKNSHVYVKQAFMINHFSSDELYFRQIAREVVEELKQVTSSDLSAYAINGDLLYASNGHKFAENKDDDLKNALDGRSAYTVFYSNSVAEVYYSYPVIIEGKKVGILRFAKDFSLLYGQSKHILDFIFYVTIAIFAAAFIFSYILSRNITIPVVMLTKASTEVTNGNLNIHFAFKRKDEIGQLAANFSLMINKIKLQIERIEQDRDRLKELNRHRKQFFDNVTHELKTPLTTILGYAEMIRRNGQSDEVFFDKGMNHIVDESKRLHEMVVKMLELSQETTGPEPFEAVNAGQLATDVCEGMAIKAERYKKTVLCRVEEDLLVFGNPDRLRQLLINVVDNAIKYGFADTDILVNAWLEGGIVHVTVTNKGEEMSAEDTVNVFAPFYRSGKGMLKETGSMGLGLSICKEIAEEHQGEIAITSRDHEIVVSIKLPYSGESDRRHL